MKVKLILTGREPQEAEDKINEGIEELVKGGNRLLGISDTGMRVLLSYMPSPTQPAQNPTMSDGAKRYVTPEEMKKLEESREDKADVKAAKNALKEIKKTGTISFDKMKKNLHKKPESDIIKKKNKKGSK